MSRSGIMLCYPFEEKRLSKWSPPYLVQPKLDGERCRYINKGDYSFLFSSEENPIWGVPHIKKFLDDLNIQLELDGELYCHGMAFEEIHSIVSREVNIHSDHQNMEYHIFDIVNDLPQFQRTQLLNSFENFLKSDDPVRVVPTYVAYTLEDIMQRYDEILSKGYEGIVVREINNQYVRKRSTSMMKFKPKKQDDYKIVGFNEEISIHGEPKGRLGALICKGDDGTLFNVGSGFTADIRARLWHERESLVGRTVTVSYQHLTHGQGVPRFPVFMSLEN